MTETVLPYGLMRTTQDGLPAVLLRCSRHEAKSIRAWFDRLKAFNRGWLLLPVKEIDTVFQGDGGLELQYSSQLPRMVPLNWKTAEWSHDLPAALPSILGLARFVINLVEALARQKVDDVALSPAFVRFLPDEAAPWRVVPLPTREASLGQWARSDPEAWLWLSPPSILSAAIPDPSYTLGSCLHHGLVGAVFPEGLGRREKFQRVLRGRAGSPSRLETAVKTALPRARGSDARELTGLILGCLDSRPGKRITAADAVARFSELERKLAIDDLIKQWEYENRPAVAAKLKQSSRGGSTVPVVPPPHKPWSDLVEQFLAEGRLTDALDASWNAIRTEGPSHIHMYLKIAQRIAGQDPPPVSRLTAALARLVESYGPELVESDFLRLTHLQVRYLNTPESELGQLDRGYQGRWNEGTALLLRAKLQLGKGQDYPLISRLCKEGRNRFETAAPGGGGAAAAYPRAYLFMLDGIAHIGYVSLTGLVDYYTDAVSCFTNAFNLADQVNAADLVVASLLWLAWLGQMARLFPTMAVHCSAIETILSLHGMSAADGSIADPPGIPWYDDSRVFPL
jgi:hypothetical protein